MPTWKKTKYTADEIKKIQVLISQLDVLSLSIPLRGHGREGDDDLELGETIIDISPSPQDLVEISDRKEFLVNAIKTCLKPRETRVMLLLYGFETGHRKTLQEVGDMYGVSRERIRQIESKALKKLRWYICTKHRIKGWEDI